MQVLKRLAPVILFACWLLSSCKKADVQASNLTSTPAVSGNTSLQKDSALAYSKDIYLWYSQIPASFNAQSYTDLDALMTSVRQYSIEPGFSTAVDRWSFAIKQTDWDNVSSGVNGDFGLSVFFMKEGDLRVKLVEPASPAGLAGIKRGWRIIKINGSDNITTSNSSFIVQNVFNSANTSFTFIKPDNTSVTLNLVAASYQANPIILDTVYNVGSKKIGYFAFNSFLGDTTVIYNRFANTFSRYAATGINDLIIDLRYNGGGYVSLSEKLADYVAPLSANGGLMMTQKFNDKYTQYNETTLVHKLGSLNLGRVFFIVSNSTASASELLINNLRPYMDVQLVGPTSTYGKPVGFFPIPVGDWYIFPVSFRTTNKNGEGGYFNGLPANAQVADGLDKNWGDLSESCLSSTVNYIVNGVYGRTQTTEMKEQAQTDPAVTNGNKTLDLINFKGSIGDKKWKP